MKSAGATVTPSFVITLELDASSFAWLNALRQSHFPPAINVLDAHLTLFHKIDADGVALVAQQLPHHSGHEIALSFVGLRSLGRGTAVQVDAPDLVTLRAEMARTLAGRLTAQDAQPFRPHVTIQNKVAPDMAKALIADLAPAFTRREGQGVAIQIWEYLGGPWRLSQRVALSTIDARTLLHVKIAERP